MLRLEEVNELDFAGYQNLILAKNPLDLGYTIAHNPKIVDVLEEVFGYRRCYFEIMSGTDCVGYVNGCWIKDKFVSMPHFSYGAILLRDDNSNLKLLTNFFERFEIRGFRILSDFYQRNKLTSYLELMDNTDSQHRILKYNVRRQLRIASENLDIEFGGVNSLDDFYWVYAKNMKRLGSPPQPKRFFKRLLEVCGENEAIIVNAYYKEKCVGSSFYMAYEDVAEVCWSASDINYNKFYVPYLLHWELIKYSIRAGKKIFSFGRSTYSSGSYKYKRNWKPTEHPLVFNYDKPSKSKQSYIRNLSRLWSRLVPVKTGIFLGKILSKHIY